jgi:N-acylneuraminate cytidylyltransferase
MKNLAIIPARGGSKRIPGKNIKNFFGKPIIAYSIEVAIKSGLFDEVMVSTDEREISQVAKKYGAKVPFMRSNRTSDDYTILSEVIEEVKEEYSKKQIVFDYICCILPTAPLITLENLKKGYEEVVNTNVDSVRPVVQFVYPIQRAVKMKNGKIEMFNPEYKKTRSQDLEPAYYDAGQFYWMRYETGLNGNNNFGFEISATQAQDIDTEDDWVLAGIKYAFMTQKRGEHEKI